MGERYWMIAHNAAQEGNEEDILSDFCFQRFGNKTAYVQGVAACSNWKIHKISEGIFDQSVPIIWGGYATKTYKIVLGIGDHGQINIISENIIEK